MRGLRSTIALAAVLAALGAYIYFVTWKKGTAETASKQEKVFTNVEADKIDDVRITSASGETTSLKKENGTWQLVAPVSAKADESEMSSLTSSLSSLEVVRAIDDHPGDLKDYGLATPRIVVDFKGGGDKDYRRLLIGDKTPTGSDMFAKRGTEPRVFLIPAYQETTFNRSTFDLRDKTVMKFDRDKVDGVEVSADSKTLQFGKEGSEWKIVKPIQARADFGSVEGLIGRLQSLQMKSIMTSDPSPADLKKYGLDKPSTSARLNLGSAQATLLVGGKADDTTVYARDSAKPAVMTIESALNDELKKGVDDYRRKDVFEFRAYNATRIELARGGQTVVFEKVKGQGANAQDKWHRVSPAAKDVDKDAMDGMVSRLSNMRASSFVDSTAKTGLDNPALTVTVKFDEGKKEEKVTFGKDRNDVYVQRPNEPGAAKVDTADFDAVIKSLDDLSK